MNPRMTHHHHHLPSSFSLSLSLLFSLCARATDDDDVNDDARVSEDTILCSFGAPVWFSI
ncbi:unnamed protein product [Bathycoccus prasinos]